MDPASSEPPRPPAPPIGPSISGHPQQTPVVPQNPTQVASVDAAPTVQPLAATQLPDPHADNQQHHEQADAPAPADVSPPPSRPVQADTRHTPAQSDAAVVKDASPDQAGANALKGAPPTTSQSPPPPTAIARPVRPLHPIIEVPKRLKSSKDGKSAILYTPTEIGLGAKQLQFAVVAKFSAGKPKAEEIRSFISANWKIKGPFTAGSLDPRHELIVLDSQSDLVEAMACPGHQVGRFLFRFFRWSPSFNPKHESSRAAVWIRVPGLNPLFFNDGLLRPIGEEIGQYLMADKRTLNMTCPAYARMLVEIDLRQPLVREVYIGSTTGKGDNYEIIYEGRLAYCSKCRMQGHNLAECCKAKQADQREKAAPGTETKVRLAPREVSQLRAKVFQEWGEADDARAEAMEARKAPAPPSAAGDSHQTPTRVETRSTGVPEPSSTGVPEPWTRNAHPDQPAPKSPPHPDNQAGNANTFKVLEDLPIEVIDPETSSQPAESAEWTTVKAKSKKSNSKAKAVAAVIPTPAGTPLTSHLPGVSGAVARRAQEDEVCKDKQPDRKKDKKKAPRAERLTQQGETHAECGDGGTEAAEQSVEKEVSQPNINDVHKLTELSILQESTAEGGSPIPPVGERREETDGSIDVGDPPDRQETSDFLDPRSFKRKKGKGDGREVIDDLSPKASKMGRPKKVISKVPGSIPAASSSRLPK
uniref:DUF4283 domain-containing protein n=1 Tax=Kalanchoe fedtschenkoi TaxID=63787 RepID=A0A7N0TX90_KALFE